MSPRARLKAVVRDLIAGAASRLPDGAVLELLDRLSLHKRMDYPGHDLFLNVASADEYFVRLFSCRKEPETVAWIEESVREGDVFYDIGANVGAYSLIASKAASGRAKVFAFEPGFANFSQLCYNIQLNDSQENVVPMPIALSDENGFAPFVLSNLKPGRTAHLQVNGNAAAGAAGKERFVQTVPTWRLDDLVGRLGMERPTLMKIDVDGAEPEVLRGARETLAHPSLRGLQVELETDDATPKSVEVLTFLREAGFALSARHVHARFANYVFERNSETNHSITSR